MGKLTFHRYGGGYYAETRHSGALDRTYFIRPAPGGWELSWDNSLANNDDHDGLDPFQRPTTRRILQDAKNLASAWHAHRTRTLAQAGQAHVPTTSNPLEPEAITRRPDGKPETPADTRFFDLRESGYTGPIDQDGQHTPDEPGHPRLCPAPAPISPGGGRTGTRLMTGLEPPATDAEFLDTCTTLTAVLLNVADQVSDWAAGLATLHFPPPVLASLADVSGCLAGGAINALHAARAFRDHYQDARDVATAGLRITGDST